MGADRRGRRPRSRRKVRSAWSCEGSLRERSRAADVDPRGRQNDAGALDDAAVCHDGRVRNVVISACMAMAVEEGACGPTVAIDLRAAHHARTPRDRDAARTSIRRRVRHPGSNVELALPTGHRSGEQWHFPGFDESLPSRLRHFLGGAVPHPSQAGEKVGLRLRSRLRLTAEPMDLIRSQRGFAQHKGIEVLEDSESAQCRVGRTVLRRNVPGEDRAKVTCRPQFGKHLRRTALVAERQKPYARVRSSNARLQLGHGKLRGSDQRRGARRLGDGLRWGSGQALPFRQQPGTGLVRVSRQRVTRYPCGKHGRSASNMHQRLELHLGRTLLGCCQRWVPSDTSVARSTRSQGDPALPVTLNPREGRAGRSPALGVLSSSRRERYRSSTARPRSGRSSPGTWPSPKPGLALRCRGSR